MIEKDLFSNPDPKDMSHIAMLCFGTTEDIYVKTKGCFVEIRVKGESEVLQIQDNGSMMLMKKFDPDEFFHPIPNCFQIVKFLIEKGYSLPTNPIL